MNRHKGQPGAELSQRTYIRWDAPNVEQVPPNEKEDIEAVIAQFNGIQRTFFNKSRHCFGGTHARTQGIIKGTFVVSDDISAHLKQTELFAQGGEYPVACRYSTEPSDPGLDDRIAQPRGFAMKIFGVKGEKFDDGAKFDTQDIEFNSTPAIELADAKTTKEIANLRITHGGDPKKLYQCLEARHDAELQKSRDQVPNVHLGSIVWYSQTAYRFGDYIIKYRLRPSSQTQRKLSEQTVQSTDQVDVHSRWLQDFHANHEAEFEFQVQLCENLDEQSIEYAGSEWDAEKYPFQTIAKLVVPKQNSFDYMRKTFWEDHMRVNSWHGLKTLQPLGSSNRLRRDCKRRQRFRARERRKTNRGQCIRRVVRCGGG